MNIETLKSFYKRFVYNDSLVGLFINPFYISRSKLYRGIKGFAPSFKGGKLLDVGCGSKPYEDLFDVEEYIGLDVEVSGHDHNDSKVDIYYDGRILPFEDNSFDYVFSSEVLEHVFDFHLLLNEIERVLKPSGKLLLTTPFCWDEHEIPYDYARYSAYALKYELEERGFENIQFVRSTTFVETIFQLTSSYIFQCVLPKNRIARVLLNPVFVAPFNILGLFFGAILPDSKGMPLNIITRCSLKEPE